MTIIFAIILGLLFGFVLQKAGAANPQRIIDMLRLKDFHLMKVITFAIGISSLVLFLLLAINSIDVTHVSIKASYLGVILGGAIFGLGWAGSGYCPGTGIVAIGTGRKDALFFILGGLAGALIFTLIYGSLVETFLFNSLGGKTTLSVTGNSKFSALLPSMPGLVIAGTIAILFIMAAWKLPAKKIS